MKRIVLVAAFQTVLASFAAAQVPSSYDGTWRGTRPGASDSEMQLNGSTGTWKVFVKGGPAHNDACVSRTRPVSVTSASEYKLTLTVNGSAIVPGCPDLEVNLTRTESNVLVGRVQGQAMDITFVRK